MSDEKYITDGAYGVTTTNAKMGYDDAKVDSPDRFNTWDDENAKAKAFYQIEDKFDKE